MPAAFVQTNFNNTGSTVTSITAVYSSAQTAGNCNVVAVFSDALNNIVGTLSDTKGNVYTPVLLNAGVAPIPNGVFATLCLTIFVAQNIAAATGGANTVTATFTGSTTFADIQILEYSGVASAHACMQSVFGQGTGTALGTISSPTVATVVANELVLCWGAGAGSGSLTVGSGWTKRTADTFCTGVEDQVVATAGTQVTGTWAIPNTGAFQIAILRLQPSTVTFSAAGGGVGEVIAYGPLLSSNGIIRNFVPENIMDANSYSAWSDTNGVGAWVGIDCGAAVSPTRARISAVPAFEDDVIGGKIQGSVSDPAFGSPITLFTIANRLNTGTLLNEYSLVSGGSYRYYRFIAPNGASGIISDLDIIFTCATGAIARCVQPVASPPGGQFDQPTLISLSSITTGASIFYTLDGSVPTTASTAYTGPFVLSANTTVNAIANLAGVYQSRISSYQFYCNPSNFVTPNQITDNRNYPVWSIDGQILYDPVSGFWFKYGTTYDEPGVIEQGGLGLNCYKSADLRNWNFVSVAIPVPAGTQIGNNNYYTGRSWAFYNALNNNYVIWCNVGGTSTKNVYTSSVPQGPFTLFATYTTLNGITFNTGVNTTDGSGFVDSDGVTAYILSEMNGGTQTLISRLNSSYTNVDGVNFQAYNNVSVFGNGIEAPTLFVRSGVYYLIYSLPLSWTPNLNKYATASSPIGTYTVIGNPFQANANPSNTIAFDSQTNKVLQIPGRGDCQIYLGDRYDTGLNTTTGQALGSNMLGFTKIMLPVAFAGSAMSITWTANWGLDATFPSVSGAPVSPSGLIVSSGSFRWINNEPKAVCLYLDFSTTSNFAAISRSEVVSLNISPPPATYTPVTAYNSAGFYRIRAVNASGTSVSGSQTAPVNSVTAVGPIPAPATWAATQLQSAFSNSAAIFPLPPTSSTTTPGCLFNIPDTQTVAPASFYVPGPGRGIVTCSGAGVVQYNLNPAPAWTTVISNLPCRIMADGKNVRFQNPTGASVVFTFYRENSSVDPLAMVP